MSLANQCVRSCYRIKVLSKQCFLLAGSHLTLVARVRLIHSGEGANLAAEADELSQWGVQSAEADELGQRGVNSAEAPIGDLNSFC